MPRNDGSSPSARYPHTTSRATESFHSAVTREISATFSASARHWVPVIWVTAKRKQYQYTPGWRAGTPWTRSGAAANGRMKVHNRPQTLIVSSR